MASINTVRKLGAAKLICGIARQTAKHVSEALKKALKRVPFLDDMASGYDNGIKRWAQQDDYIELKQGDNIDI